MEPDPEARSGSRLPDCLPRPPGTLSESPWLKKEKEKSPPVRVLTALFSQLLLNLPDALPDARARARMSVQPRSKFLSDQVQVQVQVRVRVQVPEQLQD